MQNKGRLQPGLIIGLRNLRDEQPLRSTSDKLVIGPTATWLDLQQWSELTLPELHQIIVRFGSPQIRYVGTIVGNVANASSIADSLPFLHVMGATVQLTGVNGSREVDINNFYLGYKNLDMGPEEMIRGLRVPLPAADQMLKLYKISKRRDMDIATFTAAILVAVDDGVINSARIACGGVGTTVLRLPETEEFLIGNKMTVKLMRQAGEIARDEIQPVSDVRGTQSYRRQLAENILVKFYHDVRPQLADSLCV